MKKRSMIRILNILLITGLTFAGALLLPDPYAGSALSYSVDDIQIGDHIYMGEKTAQDYTGLPYWRVLDKETDGTLLLMSEYLWTGKTKDDLIIFNADHSKENYWQGSDAQAWCTGFMSEVLQPVDGLVVLGTTRSDEAYTSPDKATISYRKVDNILQGDQVFFLSAEEAVRYMPTKEARVAYLHDGSSKGRAESWWLRSPRSGEGTNWCAGRVFSYGSVEKNFVYNLSAARPVFRADLSSAEKISKSNKGDWLIDYEYADIPDDDPAPEEPGNKPDNGGSGNQANGAGPETIRPGSVHQIQGAVYRVLSVSPDTALLEMAGNAKSITVPSDIKIGNRSFEVTEIGAKAFTGAKIRKVTIGKNVRVIRKDAFAGSKARTVIIKSALLKKATVKGCLKGSKVRSIQIKIGRKAQNKKILKKYKKIFTKKNAGRKVKIK